MGRFLVREIAGWVLMLLGLFVFYLTGRLLLDEASAHILEAGPMCVMGIVIFRGGIHLLKVAVASRICMRADAEARPAAAARLGARPATLAPAGSHPRWGQATSRRA